MYCNSMSLQIWLLCVSMLNFGQVSYFGIHRSPLLLLTSNYWKEKGHLEETTQAWSWLKCLEKVNKSPRWWWKLVFYIISTMVQSVKKSNQGFSLLKKKATPNICWSEICIKHTQQLQAGSFKKEILPRFQKIDFMEDVSLVQMRKKIPSLSTINDIAAFKWWKPAVHQQSLVMVFYASKGVDFQRNIAIECPKNAASNCQKSHSKNHHVPSISLLVSKKVFFVLCFLGINL